MTRRGLLASLPSIFGAGCLSAGRTDSPSHEPTRQTEVTFSNGDGYARVGSDIAVYDRAGVTTRDVPPAQKDTLTDGDFKPLATRDDELAVLIPVEVHPPASSPAWIAGKWLLTAASGRTRPLQEVTPDRITFIRTEAADGLHDGTENRVYPSIPSVPGSGGIERFWLCFLLERLDQLEDAHEFRPTLHYRPEVTGDCIGCVESEASITWDIRLSGGGGDS